jgi:hypothetical protein
LDTFFWPYGREIGFWPSLPVFVLVRAAQLSVHSSIRPCGQTILFSAINGSLLAVVGQDFAVYLVNLAQHGTQNKPVPELSTLAILNHGVICPVNAMIAISSVVSSYIYIYVYRM